MRRLLVLLLGAGLLACALPEDQGPAEPDPVPEGPSTVASAPPASGDGLVLGSPSTTPEPASEADPEEPQAEASPSPPPEASGCGEPAPPDLLKINVAVHLRGPNAWTLDATPLVGPNADYCAQVGFTDGRANCAVRPEGHPEREACEALLVGAATDTGRPGPTWARNGSPCTGSASGCENDPDNQYLLRAVAAGLYTACARNGVCGERAVDR